MIKKIRVHQYSSNEIVLSNNQVVKGSALLNDEGSFFPLEIKGYIEDFLKEQKNYSFLEMFKNKEIFIVGCGQNFIIPDLKIRKLIYNMGFKLEWVITPIAIQTFNMILDDNRACFALLINEIKSL